MRKKPIFYRIWSLAVFLVLLGTCGATASDEPAASILISSRAHELEKFAAAELQGYLDSLFNAAATVGSDPDHASTIFVLGDSEHAKSVCSNSADLPDLSDQGFLLRKTTCGGRPAFVVAGGSPAATMWGVYELAERYGVRFLLHGDVLPAEEKELFLPDIDQVFEPTFRARWVRTMGDFAMGTEAWSVEDYEPLLDQLAKLKFNRIRVGNDPSRPFLHLEANGVKQDSATLFFGRRYFITDDMPGRALFGDAKEFWNADLPLPGASYEEFAAAGRRHLHNLVAYARSRGMDASYVGSLIDFPKGFESVVPEAQTVPALGGLTIGPGPGVRPDHAGLIELAGTKLRTVIDTYPQLHSYGFAAGTESRSWVDAYEWSWNDLNERYQIDQVTSLSDLLEKAAGRTAYTGGGPRAVTEVKADLAGLSFLTRLYASPDVVPRSANPDAQLVVYETAEELFPILPHILPEGTELVIVLDYTPTRVLRRRHVLATVPTDKVPTTLVLTLQDDNIGMFPQLTGASLHELVGEMRKNGIYGLCTRHWMVSDLDPSISYLSKAAWNEDATPEAVYADQIRAVCGEPSVQPMMEAFRELEATTVIIESSALSLAGPYPSVMMRHWGAGELSGPLAEIREGCRKTLAALKRVPKQSREEGKAYLDYWIGRMRFGIGFIDTIEAVKKAATLEAAAKAAEEKGDSETQRTKLKEAVSAADAAKAQAFDAIELFAGGARNRADYGAIVTLAEYVFRPLSRKAEGLRAELLLL